MYSYNKNNHSVNADKYHASAWSGHVKVKSLIEKKCLKFGLQKS